MAGEAVEFDLDGDAERALVAACAHALGDPGFRARVPFHRAAYLAWRVGCCTLAASSLAPGPDRARFEALATRYAASLRLLLVRAAAPD